MPTPAEIFPHGARKVSFAWQGRGLKFGAMNLSLLIAGIFGLQGPEMLILLALVLVFFGAKKLPQFARGLGKSVGEFRRAKEEYNEELNK